MMSGKALHSALSFFLAALISGLLVACENTVEPFADSSRHFAIFGFLDAAADTQYLRVEPTRPRPDRQEASTEVPSLTTTNLFTNESVVWRDSTIQLENGSTGLLFWAVFKPTPGHAYELEVKREDGATSSATTAVPDFDDIEIMAPRQGFSGLVQTIVLGDVSRRPEKVEISYEVALAPGDSHSTIHIDYGGFGAPVEDGWQIIARLSRDRELINSRLSVAPSRALLLYEVSMTVRLLSSDWPLPESEGRFTNVVDGFGFVGSAATHTVQWKLDSLVVEQLGFTDNQSSEDPNR